MFTHVIPRDGKQMFTWEYFSTLCLNCSFDGSIWNAVFVPDSLRKLIMQWNRSIVIITTSAGGKITFPTLHLILFSTPKRVNFNEVENLKSDSSQTWLSMNPHCLIILNLRRRSETIDTQQMVWCLNAHVPKCTLTYWKLFPSKSAYSVVYYTTKTIIPSNRIVTSNRCFAAICQISCFSTSTKWQSVTNIRREVPRKRKYKNLYF